MMSKNASKTEKHNHREACEKGGFVYLQLRFDVRDDSQSIIEIKSMIRIGWGARPQLGQELLLEKRWTSPCKRTVTVNGLIIHTLACRKQVKMSYLRNFLYQRGKRISRRI
jgi:hypothetical protein